MTCAKVSSSIAWLSIEELALNRIITIFPAKNGPPEKSGFRDWDMQVGI
jgi:hypothetical protein